MVEIDLDSLISNWKKTGLVKQVTNSSTLKKILQEKKTVYLGIDPTSDSLHIGHLVPLVLMKQISDLGCPIIILIGNQTCKIGDPSFRLDKRLNLKTDVINKNSQKIKKQIQKILPEANIFSNEDWLRNLLLVDFLDEIGKLFTINKILEKESLDNSLQQGTLFYSDFSYILLQAYDFYYLWKKHNCFLQVGGSDQYPNIVFGIDLIRKLSQSKISVCGVTTNLLLDSSGKKISKTLNKQIWLDHNKTSLHEMYQFFYNLDDQTALSWMKMFSLDCHVSKKTPKNFKERVVQKKLFFSIINWVFDKQTVLKVKECLLAFEKNVFSILNLVKLKFFLPWKEINFTKMSILEIMIEVGFVSSKTKALHLVQEKAIKLNGQLVNDPSTTITKDFLLKNQSLILGKGKSKLFLVIFKL